MTDRELLELAAKAAGITYRYGYYKEIDGVVSEWNPLEDDGDALRLAVKLQMSVDTCWNGGANAGNAEVDFADPEWAYTEGTGAVDHYAATRRAIVRAAAEIGRSMK